jgi:hypothetical protein
VDETAGMLAADFLAGDLDELERDLLTGQTQKQQVIRHVVSLAQEFPASLEELRNTGACDFTLSLESLERQLAGATNLRIGTVDLRPVGLMRAQGFVVEVTCLGDGQVRLPRTSGSRAAERSWATPANSAELSLIDKTWPMMRRLAGPEACLFSGVAKADEHAASPFVITAQRNAFERLPAASSWRIDMNLQRNRVIPGSLADIEMIFHLVGYHDPLLRAEIERSPARPRLAAQVISASKEFADGFYELVHEGRMAFSIGQEWFALQPPAGALRNLALALIPSPFAPMFNNLFARFEVVVLQDNTGNVVLQHAPPQFQFTIQRLKVDASIIAQSSSAVVSWRFGHDSAWVLGTSVTHNFSRSGSHRAFARIVEGGRLREFSFELNVRDDLDCAPPVTAHPTVQLIPPPQQGAPLKFKLSIGGNPAGEALSMQLAENGVTHLQTGPSIDLKMVPGRERRIQVTICRDLKARFHGFQNVKQALIPIPGLRVTTNRRFDPDTLTEDNAHVPNAFSGHIFEDVANTALTISPMDEWQIEISRDDNPFLTVADPSRVGLQHLHDAVLVLEHESEA